MVGAEAEKADAAKAVKGDADPLLVGPDSPALEEYRREKVLLIRMDRLEREGTLVPRKDLDPALDQLAAVYRRAGETLQRMFGGEAVKILDEAVSEAEERWGRMFPDAGNSQQPNPDLPPADGGSPPNTAPT